MKNTRGEVSGVQSLSQCAAEQKEQAPGFQLGHLRSKTSRRSHCPPPGLHLATATRLPELGRGRGGGADSGLRAMVS